MLATVNPFRPSAGANPPELLGREEILDEFEESLISGPGSPSRLLRITGSRGAGKTVLLNALGNRARIHNWQVLDETATPGFINQIIFALEEASQHKTVKSIDLPSLGVDGIGSIELGSIEFDRSTLPLTIRRTLTECLERIAKHHPERGLLITLDETQGADPQALRALATAVQHLIREDRNIAIAFAGLPGMSSFLLHDEVTTFLRRATPVNLTDIPLDLVKSSFTSILNAHDYTIDQNALDAATAATYGYPFMIQLVGYNIWRRAKDNHIDLAAALSGIESARIRLGGTVHEPAVEDLSDVDRTYLLAMAQDDGPSRTGDVAKRMGRDLQYAGRYRERLIQAGIIYPVSYGYVDFTIPYLREWLQQHAATLVMQRSSQA
ncbi:ATP-binding protein [Bifidobacterium oedipodis]|uniref:Orc1-like AAA ATPase domain-containing protein n=1 Tax=Bifidobacterium oedipodis TaxID=2675322 RepID=A0A7Y0HUF1_9BIFI|nr:ATP-binding protein [Bifidobacterium sp. DSM 109957]NMM94684.1 hypothetical protein [Bifidobacterium sp. DSM 109957]